MQELPLDLDLNVLPGPKRGVVPAHYFRDEIVFSLSGTRFALAYTIFEATMGNYIGCLLWGKVGANGTEILGNPESIRVTCWDRPWAIWLNDESFVFKAHYCYGNCLYLPLVVMNITGEFAVVPNTNNTTSRPSDVRQAPLFLKRGTKWDLLRAIRESV